jgi:hypothetical protein
VCILSALDNLFSPTDNDSLDSVQRLPTVGIRLLVVASVPRCNVLTSIRADHALGPVRPVL